MDVTTVKSLFENAIQLGFQQIILTGGNLLKEWSTVRQLAPFFKDIEVYTIVNLLMLNEDVINEINNIDNLNCIINVPILEEQLDVTSLYKIMALIQQYKRNTIKYGFQINAMYHKNINAIHSLITNCRLSSNDYYVEFVGEKYFPIVNHELRNYLTKAKLSYPDYQTFYYKKQYNYCMNGSLVIGYDGSVYVCRMMRRKNYGNIHKQPLYTIIVNKEIQEKWRLTIDQISPCKDCSLRYACNECRAFESTLSGSEHSVAICRRGNIDYAD